MNAEKVAMKLLLAAIIGLVALHPALAAETAYDRKLEKSAMKIVAGRMGELRGSIPYTQPLAAARKSAAGVSSMRSIESRASNSGGSILVIRSPSAK